MTHHIACLRRAAASVLLIAMPLTAFAGNVREVRNPVVNGRTSDWVVRTGGTMDVVVDYQVNNAASGALFQFTLGMDDTPHACIYNGVPGNGTGVSGSASASWTAPTTSGAYDLTWAWSYQFNCADALAGYAGNFSLGTVQVGNAERVMNADIDGQGTSAVVLPGQTFNVTGDYEITYPDAPTSIRQVMFGIEDEGAGCVYHGVAGGQWVRGSGTLALTAPTTPGIYTITWAGSASFSCTDGLNGYNPYYRGIDRTMGTIEVCEDVDANGICDRDEACEVTTATATSIGAALGLNVATGDTCGGSTTYVPPDPMACGPEFSPGVGPEVAYTWVAPYSSRFVVTTYGSDFDTGIEVLDSSSGTCTEVACNDDYPGSLQSSVVLDAVGGQTYTIVVDGYGANCGDFDLSIVPVSAGVLRLESPVRAGSTVQWTVFGAVPGAPMRLYFSRPGATAGNPTPFPGGPMSNLPYPKGVLQVTVPPEGAFVMSATAPANLPAGLPFSFDAVSWNGSRGGVTNAVTAISQ